MSLTCPEQVALTTGAKWDYGALRTWFKRKRRVILICGVMVVVVGGGLLAHRLIFSLADRQPTLEPLDASIMESDSSSTDTQSVLKSGDSSMGVSMDKQVASTSTPSTKNRPRITDKHRTYLEDLFQNEDYTGWNEIIDKSTQTLEYKLLSRFQKGHPIQYLSRTLYKEYTDTTQIMNFMTDNEYKLENDKVLESFETLDVDATTGIEVWHAIKNFPVIGHREYILASKIWENEVDKSYLCVTTTWLDHPKAPKPEHTLVQRHFSGWRISKVRGNGCEVKLFHQEDIQSKVVDWTKSFLTSQIWSYVQETEGSLKKYMSQTHPTKTGPSAVTYLEKIRLQKIG